MITKAYGRKTKQLGAFEISSDMVKLARENDSHDTFLNAGRGNPNWINTQARLAFARLMEFGVTESRRTLDNGYIAGNVEPTGIVERFKRFFRSSDETDAFIMESIDYAVQELGQDREELICELTNAVVGNNYPVPSRCLENIEQILAAFLQDTLFGDEDLADETDVFPTEGGTAAICYIFDCLKHNCLLEEGDYIAINTPIFTPYIQIPRLTNFRFTEINLNATEESNWHVPDAEFDKLLDPNVKAFFLVNPTNPGAHALSEDSLECIRKIVEQRPDLIIITDDVYGTFAKEFKTVYSVAPRNTLLVYSYSKLYGVTGWRTGLIALNKENIFDELIAKLPPEKQEVLDFDYSIVTTEPREMKFIDRICADSRPIGLYHTSGLSTPQQAMMALLSLTHLVVKADDDYIKKCDEIIARRYHTLMSNLGLPEDDSPSNTKYYTLINIFKLAEHLYGQEFADYFKENCNLMEFITSLAKNKGVVLMEGGGFSAPTGTLRVSFANLPDEAYERLATRLIDLIREYYEKYVARLNN